MKKQFIYILFLLSGVSALIYQIAWQRELFILFGVNIESTTIIVTVFMLGLGFGSLFGAWLSKRFKTKIILIFAILEIAIGTYGFMSMNIFSIISVYSVGVGKYLTALFSIIVLLLPTLLMGASLPLLVEYINKKLKNPAKTVADLYFYNTIGSAIASFLTVIFLFEIFGLSGTIYIAALLNILIGTLVYGKYRNAY